MKNRFENFVISFRCNPGEQVFVDGADKGSIAHIYPEGKILTMGKHYKALYLSEKANCKNTIIFAILLNKKKKRNITIECTHKRPS